MMQTQFLVSQLSPAITIVQCDAASTNIKRAIIFRHLLLHSIRYLFKYCLDIWCFTRTLERYLFKDSHSTEACDGCCKTSFQHRPLQPLIVSFLHFSQPGRAKPLSIYNDVDHWWSDNSSSTLMIVGHHWWRWLQWLWWRWFSTFDNDRRGPGDLSQLPFNCEGTAVDPLQRVHVRVQHLHKRFVF